MLTAYKCIVFCRSEDLSYDVLSSFVTCVIFICRCVTRLSVNVWPLLRVRKASCVPSRPVPSRPVPCTVCHRPVSVRSPFRHRAASAPGAARRLRDDAAPVARPPAGGTGAVGENRRRRRGQGWCARDQPTIGAVMEGMWRVEISLFVRN